MATNKPGLILTAWCDSVMGSVGEPSFGSGPCGAGANHETDGVETKGASLSPLINLLPDPIIYRVHLVFLPLTYSLPPLRPLLCPPLSPRPSITRTCTRQAWGEALLAGSHPCRQSRCQTLALGLPRVGFSCGFA